MRLALAMLLLVVCPASAEAPTPEGAWHGRGVLALSGIDGLKRDLASATAGSARERTLLLEMGLEMAWALHADPRREAAVHVHEADGESFRLVLVPDGKEAGLLGISYSYRDGEVVKVTVNSLPKRWSVAAFSEAPGGLVLQSQDALDGPSLLVSLADPFLTQVLPATGTEAPATPRSTRTAAAHP
jgi:hypothetical protein